MMGEYADDAIERDFDIWMDEVDPSDDLEPCPICLMIPCMCETDPDLIISPRRERRKG